MKNTLFNRRDALKSTLTLGLASLIPQFGSSKNAEKEEFNPPKSKIYLTKHGHQNKDSKFLWSSLTVTNESQLTNSIRTLLSSNKYFSQMTYSSNDKYKVVPAKALIDLVLQTKGISFKMVLFDSDPNDFKNLSPKDSNLKKTGIYKEMLKNVNGTTVVSKTEDRFGPSSSYTEKFNEVHGKGQETVNAKADLILQLNDLISGVCFSILTSKPLISSTKIQINEHFELKTQLSKKKNQTIINLPNIEIKKLTI